MSAPDFNALESGHRKYFQSGATRSVEWREMQLTALRAMMKDHAESSMPRYGRTSATASIRTGRHVGLSGDADVTSTKDFRNRLMPGE